MKHFPDNIKCLIRNSNQYFTHYFDGLVDFGELELYYLMTTDTDVRNGNGYQHSQRYSDNYPDSSLLNVVKSHYRGNESYKNHDFSKDDLKEVSFGELPEKVKEIFRKFETHEDFNVSEAIAFRMEILV